MHYETVAAAYRDLEQVSSRLALIDRLAELLRQTPAGLLPRVVYLCLGEIAPAFAGIDIGMADKMVTRALADHTGVPLDEVRVVLRETGDLGLTAEQLLAGHRAADRAPTLEVGVVFETLHTALWGVLKEDAGLALRFPRFTGRYRDDKAPEDATTVQEILDLYRLARPTPAG